MKKTIIYLFLFLILIAQASSFELLEHENKVYQADRSFTFWFQAVNYTAAEYDCNFDAWDTQGNHIISENTTKSGDFHYITISSGNNSEGSYNYQVACNATGGLTTGLSGSYGVTSDSEDKNRQGTGLLTMIIAIPLVLAFFLILGAMSLGKDHDLIRIFFLLLSLPFTWVSLNIGMIGVVKFYGLTSLEDVVSSFTFWTTVIFFVVVSYFIIYFIIAMFDASAQKKKERLNY